MERDMGQAVVYLFNRNAASKGMAESLQSFPQFLFIFKLQDLRWKNKVAKQQNEFEQEVQPLQYKKVTVTVAEKMQGWNDSQSEMMKRDFEGHWSAPYECSLCTNVHDTQKKRKPTGSITLSHDYESSRRWLPSQASTWPTLECLLRLSR